MRITVKLGAPLSQVVGESKIDLAMPEGATVADVLDELRARYPDFEAGLKGKGLRKPLDQVIYSLFVNARPCPLRRPRPPGCATETGSTSFCRWRVGRRPEQAELRCSGQLRGAGLASWASRLRAAPEAPSMLRPGPARTGSRATYSRRPAA